MPLLVQCPSGCQIRMSRNRAGKIVRCPECKCEIRVPKLLPESMEVGSVHVCQAKVVEEKDQQKDRPGKSGAEVASGRLEVPKFKPRRGTGVILKSDGVVKSDRGSTRGKAFDSLSHSQKDSQTTQPRAKHVEVNSLGRESELSEPNRLKTPDPALPLRAVGNQNSPGLSRLHSIRLSDPVPVEKEKNWEVRLTNANSDRRILARFFALCLCLVALVNMVPAIYQWYHWTQLSDSVPLPRWIYIQIFVGLIYFIYAIFLAQIPDWSAMRAVSIALLLIAFVFGSVSTGLLVGGEDNLASFLGIPFALNRQACIWCVAMLFLATLMSYWGGKEAANWQRAEHLLKGILAKTPV